MSNAEFVLPLLMMAALIAALFTGYPVVFVLAGIGLFFAGIGSAFDLFNMAQLFLIVSRSGAPLPRTRCWSRSPCSSSWA